MKYSVWNWNTKKFDYYEDSKQPSFGGPTRKIRGNINVGIAPEKASHPLPSSAKFVGSGEKPLGYIASGSAEEDSSFNFNNKWLMFGGLALAAYGLMKYLK